MKNVKLPSLILVLHLKMYVMPQLVSNTEKWLLTQCFVEAPKYSDIRRDIHIPTVKEEISRYSSHYSDRLRTHLNHLAVNLLGLPDNRRLLTICHSDFYCNFLLSVIFSL
jgi:hypothetical protein